MTDPAAGLTEETKQAYAFVDTMVSRADGYADGYAPLWHGWALREAYLAGRAAALSVRNETVREALTRDEILIHPKCAEIAMQAAKRIGRAERLDNVSQKEIYRTIIESIAAGYKALASLDAPADPPAVTGEDVGIVSLADEEACWSSNFANARLSAGTASAAGWNGVRVFITDETPNALHGVCVGGRFDGWLMWQHPDGQWVTLRKLKTADPTAAAPAPPAKGD